MKNRKISIFTHRPGSCLTYRFPCPGSCLTNRDLLVRETRTRAKSALQIRTKTLNFIYLATIFCILLSACGKTKDFEFRRIESLDLHDISFKNSSIGGRLLFYNPNHFGVTLKHLESEVEVDGNHLGTCTADSTIHIKGNEEFSVPVVIHFTTAAALMGGLNMLTKDSVMVRFTGSMKVGRVGVFINYKFDNLNKVSTRF